MTAIDPLRLDKAMTNAGITPLQLAERVDISLQYMCDLRAGRSRAKRKPVLRRRIADVLGVPRQAIEVDQ